MKSSNIYWDRTLHEIYLSEIEFKTENKSRLEALFLGLDVKISDSKFKLSVYDKGDIFTFSII